MQRQNFIPKNKEKFWGKFNPICQFIKDKELKKKGFIKSKKP